MINSNMCYLHLHRNCQNLTEYH